MDAGREARIKMKTSRIALAVAFLVGGCSQVLGFKDPSLEAESDGPLADGPGADGASPDSAPPDARPIDLWVFTTNAQFPANFGAAGARTIADVKCDDMYRFAHTSRKCTMVHAVIQVDNSVDTLNRMEGNYQIPSNRPLLRASDGVKVSEKWADFVNPNLQLIEAVTPSASAVYFWSGRGVVADRQCSSWSSAANASFGDVGDSSLRSGSISAASVRCDDQRPHLLCVCW